MVHQRVPRRPGHSTGEAWNSPSFAREAPETTVRLAGRWAVRRTDPAPTLARSVDRPKEPSETERLSKRGRLTRLPDRRTTEPGAHARGHDPPRRRTRGPAAGDGLDATDLRILRSLNQDARKSYRDIARELEIALSTVSARVRRLEESGIVTGYVPVVDPARLGFDLIVVIGVKIAHGKLLEVQSRVAKSPRVFAVYDVTGEWDSVVLARFHDRDELNAFIKDLLANPHIERTATQLVLNTIKEEKRIVL